MSVPEPSPVVGAAIGVILGLGLWLVLVRLPVTGLEGEPVANDAVPIGTIEVQE